jgi:hypothetical protein
MAARIPIPPPGSPMPPSGQPRALREILEELAQTAGRSAQVPNGIDGSAGLMIAPQPITAIALFKFTSGWTNAELPAGQTWPFQPNGFWYWAQATRVEYYPIAQDWNTPADASDSTTEPETAYIWHNAGRQIDTVDPNRLMPAYHGYMPAVGIGQWAWCVFDDAAGVWQVLQPMEDIIRVKINTAWYSCCRAKAVILYATDDAPAGATGSSSGTVMPCITFNTGYEITVFDPLGTIENDPASIYDPVKGRSYIPPMIQAVVKRFADDNAWEPLRIGNFDCHDCCAGSGSSGSSSSGICVNPVTKESHYPNYNARRVQFLGHDDGGCWLWIDYAECTPSSSSGS